MMLPMADIYTIFPNLLEDFWLNSRGTPLKNAYFVNIIVYVNLFFFKAYLFPDSYSTYNCHKHRMIS